MANRVKVTLGRTIQTAQFESLRVDVGVELDVDDDVESIDDTFAAANSICNDELDAALAAGREKAQQENHNGSRRTRRD